MLWFKKKENKKTTNTTAVVTMDGTRAEKHLSENVYAYDLVMQSIRCKANEFKKLNPRHITTIEERQIVVNDSSVSKVLKRPNQYMTQSDFLEKITILLELNKNVFIYPDYFITNGGKKYYTALYPLKPEYVEFRNDGDDIFFRFGSGYSVTLPQSEVIHWKKDYGVNEFFGGGLTSNDNSGLLDMLHQYEDLTNSIATALDCSCKISGLVKYKSYLDDEKTEEKRKDFVTRIRNGESDILFTDEKTEYIPLQRDIKLVDKDTLQYFYETIIRANGTSLAVLNGDYTKAQKEAYYEHALEADIKSLGEAMTKVLFTDRESSYGNEIVLYPNEICFMSMENKLSALQIGLPAGIFTKNEARKLLGYPPIENGDELPRAYNSMDTQTSSNVTGGDTNGENG